MEWNIDNENLGPLFVQRSKELELLFDSFRYSRIRFKTAYVSGERGAGKTALLMQFLYEMRNEMHGVRISTSPTTNLQDIDQAFKQQDPEKNNRLILIVDDADLLSPETRSDITRFAQNLKRCRGVVFGMVESPAQLELQTVRHATVVELRPFSEVECRAYFEKTASEYNLTDAFISQVVALSEGNIRTISLIARCLSEGSGIANIELLKNKLYEISDNIVVPEREIISVARPQVVIVENKLIEKLKREPQSIYQLKPREFEVVLADLLDDMGYAVTLTPASGDGGKDIIAEMDTEIGKIMCLVEAKKYRADRKIGVELVRTLYGTICHHNATSGMLVTTSSFTAGAKSFQQDHQYQIALRDFTDVANWISNHGNR